nr:hypothetical protein [Gordonia araii]
MIFPVSAIAGPWLHRYNRQVEKRRQYKLEMARAKSAAQIEERRLTRVNAEQLRTALRTHDDVDERWWNYEIDLATIISYPMLVDVREPLTREFHKAKGRADMLRPPPGVEVDDPVAFVEYRDAVVEYAAAFDAAEREARRRKQADFSPIEREALERARRLVMIAADEAATPAERQAAYRKARKELDGLIEIPVVGAQQLEHSIAKELEG